MNKLYIYVCLLCTVTVSFHSALAQGENNHWHFGNGSHIDFNVTPPQYDQNSAMATFENSAAVSNAQGVAQFYTIGCRVWNRNNNEMPNATGLLGNGPFTNGVGFGSCRDCVQILPDLGNTNKYFIFSGTPSEEGADKIYIHTVDMSLNGGLGDISNKNTLLLNAGTNGLSEFTAVTYGTCNDYWFIAATSMLHNNALYAFRVNASGVASTPVISVPNISVDFFLTIRILKTKDVAYLNSSDGILRADFNRSTGQMTNFQLIPNTVTASFELSPDEQLLYMIGNNTIEQLNLQLYPNLAAISASSVTVGSGGPYYTMRIAPDGKLYMATPGIFLARIEQPNIIGPSCTYTPQAMSLPYSAMSYINPFGVQALGAPKTSVDTISVHDTALLRCAGDTVTLYSLHPDNYSFQWNTGNQTDRLTVQQPGSYRVHSIYNQCTINLDSFAVLLSPLPLELGNDTVICEGDRYTLDAYQPEADAYSWNNGSTAPSITVSVPGIYTVTVQKGSCSFTDSIHIATIIPQLDILQNDTVICTASSIVLQARSNMEDAISWSTGQTGSNIQVQGAGIYSASSETKCGPVSDVVRIEEMNCSCRPIVPNAFTPNGDGRNDVFMPVFNPDCDALYYELKIYNRYGQLVYMTNRKGTGWDGTYSNGQPADAGVYFYTVKLSNRYGDTDNQLSKGDITLVR